jgi:hypothetical protein
MSEGLSIKKFKLDGSHLKNFFRYFLTRYQEIDTKGYKYNKQVGLEELFLNLKECLKLLAEKKVCHGSIDKFLRLVYEIQGEVPHLKFRFVVASNHIEISITDSQNQRSEEISLFREDSNENIPNYYQDDRKKYLENQKIALIDQNNLLSFTIIHLIKKLESVS